MFDFFDADLLQLFAEGGNGSGDSPATANPQGSAGSLRGTPAAEGTTGETSTPAAEEKNSEGDFAKLIGKGGKYEAEYREQMRKAFNKRFAAFKETEARAQRLDGFMKTVAKRYPGVDASNPDALEKAFINDTRFHDKRSIERGNDAKTLLEAKKRDMKLARLEARDRAQRNFIKREATARRFHQSLIAQENELQKEYPDFNFVAEIKNPDMRKRLLQGYSLRDAYRSVHYNDFLARAVSDARAATVNSIAAGSTRPSEGAGIAAVPSTTRIDYSKMSDRDFLEMYNKKFRN